MFGLTFEKLLLVGALAAVLVGPSRLPGYAQELARFVRELRAFVDQSRTRAEEDLGVSLTRTEWEQVRRYDPRVVVREALADPAPTSPAHPSVLAEAARVRPGQRYLVTGGAGHPRRILLASLPADDPRRLASEVVPDLPEAGAEEPIADRLR